MLRAEQLTLATDRLSYFAHWITPEEQPLRFDTRFFAAVTPPGQEPVVDGHEIVDVRWLTADETLEAFAARRSRCAPRRSRTSSSSERRHPRAEEPWQRWRVGRREVPTIRPRVLTVDGRPVPVLPGDPRWY